MFGIYFKSSLKALAWLVLLPIGFLTLYLFVIEPFVIEEIDSFFYTGEDFIWTFVLLSMCISIVVNFLFLMIIPALFGGTASSIKKVQFYFGFFVNLFLALGLTIAYKYIFDMDGAYFGLTLGLHILGFMLPFIIGALFVAPAYARAFWFVDRNKNA